MLAERLHVLLLITSQKSIKHLGNSEMSSNQESWLSLRRFIDPFAFIVWNILIFFTWRESNKQSIVEWVSARRLDAPSRHCTLPVRKNSKSERSDVCVYDRFLFYVTGDDPGVLSWGLFSFHRMHLYPYLSRVYWYTEDRCMALKVRILPWGHKLW